MDRNPMVLPNVLLADDNDDFMGSCNLKLTKVFFFSPAFSPYLYHPIFILYCAGVVPDSGWLSYYNCK